MYKVFQLVDQGSFFSEFGREIDVLPSKKKLSCPSYVDISPTTSLSCLFLPHVTVDKVLVSTGVLGQLFLHSYGFGKHLVFPSVGGYCLPDQHSYFDALSGSHVRPTWGNRCEVKMDIFSDVKYIAFNFISLSQIHKNFKSIFGSYCLFL